jgi:hypothetical protein
MFNIRRSLFETNSSSVHVFVMCSKEEFTKFKIGELFLDYPEGKFIPKKKVLKILKRR